MVPELLTCTVPFSASVIVSGLKANSVSSTWAVAAAAPSAPLERPVPAAVSSAFTSTIATIEMARAKTAATAPMAATLASPSRSDEAGITRSFLG